MTPYAELCVTSNFTFLTGASHPEELVTRAAELGLAAIAITDRNSVAGVVRAFSALKELARLQEEARAAEAAVQERPAVRSQRVTDNSSRMVSEPERGDGLTVPRGPLPKLIRNRSATPSAVRATATSRRSPCSWKPASSLRSS